MTPVCPVHQKPMRESKFGDGSFYCAVKDPTTGAYCKHKAAGPNATAMPNAAPVQQAPKSDPLAAAALHFAGALCHGAGPEMEQDALNIAVRALRAMREAQ